MKREISEGIRWLSGYKKSPGRSDKAAAVTSSVLDASQKSVLH